MSSISDCVASGAPNSTSVSSGLCPKLRVQKPLRSRISGTNDIARLNVLKMYFLRKKSVKIFIENNFALEN